MPGTRDRQEDRPRLSRERVLLTAVDFADEEGLEALSMRKLGEKLGVEAMSLYKHVANKDDLIGGMIDGVFAEIDLPLGPRTLGHLDALIGVLRGAGFSVVLTAHALSAVDAYVYGFAMQEKALPFDTEERSSELIQQILAAMPADEWPHLVEFSREHVLKPGYDYGQEFEWGLDLVLDGLERARRQER